jgi:prepilin peptidase CpaA
MAPNHDALMSGLLTLFVGLISFYDWRESRIPNALVFPAALVGLCLNSWHGWSGLWFGLQGLGAGFMLLLIPYLFKVMGAGDVKFLAAIGAFLGAFGSLRALLLALMIYPLLAIFFVLQQGKLSVTLRRFGLVLSKTAGLVIPYFRLYAMQLETNDDASISSATTPFALSLSAGALVAIFSDWLR